MPVLLSDRQTTLSVRPLALKRRLGRLLREAGLAGAELSVSLVADEEMRRLNFLYRRRDRPTNVLSFALDEGEGGSPGGALGDVVVSTDTVIREAGQYGYSPGEMLYFYLVHGLTHLLGHDHERGPAEEARQAAETDRLWRLIPHSL